MNHIEMNHIEAVGQYDVYSMPKRDWAGPRKANRRYPASDKTCFTRMLRAESQVANALNLIQDDRRIELALRGKVPGTYSRVYTRPRFSQAIRDLKAALAILEGRA